MSVNAKDIKFYFYGGPDTTSVVEGTLDDPKFPSYPLFNATFETKMYIHGWLQKNDNETNFYLPKKYAVRGKRVNFISVDWSSHSFSIPFYPTVVEKIAPQVAEYVYQMLQRLISKNVDVKKVHLMGFGVGAHIAGLAGKRFDTSSKIARITGLSPYGPYYNNKTNSERLAKGDADLVDVIHTNMGTFGISQPIGDINFLPQGGRQQPAASAVILPPLKSVISHLVARKYYFESIEYGYGGFIGKQCDSWHDMTLRKCSWKPDAIMGENVSENVNGTVFLSVNRKSPYSRGVDGVYNY